jgi:hypothetical protein
VLPWQKTTNTTFPLSLPSALASAKDENVRQREADIESKQRDTQPVQKIKLFTRSMPCIEARRRLTIIFVSHKTVRPKEHQ